MTNASVRNELQSEPYNLDASRQWGETLAEIHKGHVRRYEFAKARVSGRVLDAACGCGYGSRILSDAGCDVTGVDNYPLAVEWAETLWPGPKYLLGNIEDKPWEGEFDWIVSLETIEHLQDPMPVLRAFRECGKRLIASTPNEEKYPFKAESFAGDNSPHYRHYTPAEFDGLLEGAGFKVTERFCQPSKLDPVAPGTEGMFLIYVCE